MSSNYASLALGVSFLVLKALTTALGLAEEDLVVVAFRSGSSDSPSDDDADEAEGFPES